MRVEINQLGNGSGVEIEGEVYHVMNFEHVKPGKGGAFVRLRLKNIKLGTIINRTFRASERLELAYIEKKKIQYLYASKDIYEFMDSESYDQISLHRDQLGEMADYLKENLEVTALMYKNKIITVELPIFIDMKISSTEPGIKGDTSKAGTKPARTESGMAILVPLFINEGDVVRIDTRTKEYVSRVT